MKKMLFGIPIEEVHRQLAYSVEIPCFSFSPPLVVGDDALGICISFGREILNDPKKKKFFHQIYCGL